MIAKTLLAAALLASASAAFGDPMGAALTGSKICDPTTHACASISAAGAIKVDSSNQTQGVSGTVTANQGTAGAGAWLVTYSAPPHVIVDTAPTTAVTGTFWQATQPVSIASMPSTPVTGTFYQATQPVSIATMPSTPVTGTFWQATQPVSGTVSVGTPAVTQSGTWTVQPGNTANTTAWKVDGSAVTQPVSGTFWQATQPVSGTVTANAGSGTMAVSGTFFQATQPVSIASMPSTPVTGTFWQATQPVSGTFFQATQPVSVASMPSTPVTGTFWQATQPVSGTVTSNQGGAPWTYQLVDGTSTTQKAAVDSAGALTVNAKQSGAYAVSQSGTFTVQPGNTQNTTAWLVTPNDGTNPETIKAAGYRATISDTAVVVTPREPIQVIVSSPPLNPFLPRCNAVRRLNCQP